MHYLDNAATTHPRPFEVPEATARCIALPGNPGRGASRVAAAATELLETCRAKVAAFVGAADPARLAFALGATDALNMALAGLVRPGAPVVASALEHAAVMRPLRRLQRSGSIDLCLVAPGPDGRLDPDDVRRASAGAALVVTTCASNVTGVAQPWQDIATALAGAATPLLLDAAQAAGTLPIAFDRLGPHVALAFSGHKALLGPMGVGALVVGEAFAVRPWREGGTGDSLAELHPEAMPRRLEAGTPPLPAIAGLAAGIDWWMRQGPDLVRRHEAELLRSLVTGLAAIDGVRLPAIPRPEDTPAPSAPLACFLLDGWSVDELAAVLEAEFHVVVRGGLHCSPDAHRTIGTHPEGAVRASIGPTTIAADVDALLNAVAQLASA